MNNTLYLAPQHIAERTGHIGSRYRVLDNQFIINYDDVRVIVLFPNETRQSLLDSLTKITEGEASRLITESGGKIGLDKKEVLSVIQSQQIQEGKGTQQEEQEENVVVEESVPEKSTKKRTKK